MILTGPKCAGVRSSGILASGGNVRAEGFTLQTQFQVRTAIHALARTLSLNGVCSFTTNPRSVSMSGLIPQLQHFERSNDANSKRTGCQNLFSLHPKEKTALGMPRKSVQRFAHQDLDFPNILLRQFVLMSKAVPHNYKCVVIVPVARPSPRLLHKN
jgi:hypothetical protein